MASSQVKEPQTERHLGSTNTVINSNKRIVQPVRKMSHRKPKWTTLSSKPTGSEAGEPNGVEGGSGTPNPQQEATVRPSLANKDSVSIVGSHR